MKKCTKCSAFKETSDFYKSSRLASGYASACKDCCNNMHTVCRKRKLAHYRQVAKSRGDANKQKLDAWKAQQKCYFCDENDVDCLDLHHLDPTQKDVDIADVVRYWSWKRLSVEMEKCIILCANCHRKVHRGKISIGM